MFPSLKISISIVYCYPRKKLLMILEYIFLALLFCGKMENHSHFFPGGIFLLDLKTWCLEQHRQALLDCYLAGDNPLPPEQIGHSSGKAVRWKCPMADIC